MTKAIKGIGVIEILSTMLPQHSLLTIQKSFYVLILTMVIYFMINQTIKVYVKKQRLFNTMLLWPLLVPLNVHLKLNFSMNQAQNPLSLDGGSENCVCFLRLKNWFTRISIQYITTKQPSVQHLSIEDVTTFYCGSDVLR